MATQIPAPAEVVLVVDANAGRVLESLTQKFNNDLQPQGSQPCTIYKVLERIRSEDPKAYDPQLISIGPYHHGNKLLLPMERIKRQFLRNLIRRHDSNTLSKYIEALSSASSVAKASKYYSEYVLPDDIDTFVEMMVLDGCFIIEFLVKSFLGEDMGELDFVNWNRSLVENDLLLLENQLPFCVLESLFGSSVLPGITNVPSAVTPEELGSNVLPGIADVPSAVTPEELGSTVLPSITDAPSTVAPEELGSSVLPGITDVPLDVTLKELASCCVSRDIQNNVQPIPQDVYHLLHLRHSSLAPTANNTQDIPTKSCMRKTIKIIKDFLLHSLFLLLSVLLRCCRPPPPEPIQRAPRSIPSATELNEAGIKFQLKNQCRMLDVTFSKGDGIMEIPLLSIQAVTVSQFRNLVAFEQCCPAAGSHFTSYVALMDNLIDTPEDVALLEYSGVLESKLSGDEEVCQFFNNLGKGAFLKYEEHNLKVLFRDVKEYYGTERHRWRARMVRDYFSNPWSAISLFAAIVLLLLTVLQSFFAVYAYFRPPPSASAPAPA